ncbi:hypothetical protein PIROE2DRAFT_59596 [Piromyces sp. E2]|nr:hypothetical protein PIROE2DRAFT_59596 [Piromyces sp. E2]|eukprot:OUM66074.1 hypothetical protein PIROE2DRAFT_59596 [Piromyces sp. E2]
MEMDEFDGKKPMKDLLNVTHDLLSNFVFSPPIMEYSTEIPTDISTVSNFSEFIEMETEYDVDIPTFNIDDESFYDEEEKDIFEYVESFISSDFTSSEVVEKKTAYDVDVPTLSIEIINDGNSNNEEKYIIEFDESSTSLSLHYVNI